MTQRPGLGVTHEYEVFCLGSGRGRAGSRSIFPQGLSAKGQLSGVGARAPAAQRRGKAASLRPA